MNLVLKSKAHYTDDAAAKVWANITDHVTKDEAEEAVERAAAEVLDVCGRYLDRVVYGWSGGKDSRALQVVMERAGVRRSLLGTIPRMEFRGYLDWVAQEAPEGLTVIPNEDLALADLAHPDRDRYLFPRTSRDGYWWTLNGTRRAQLAYQQEHHPALQIYGRRRQDGNPTGKDGLQHSRNGITSYSPIRNWPHELVLAVVHYAGLTLPPTYGWPHGWTAGTGPWPGRRVGTRDESWAETWAIEPDRVLEAAEHIPSAREWLDRQEAAR
ncbi:hypothetical protein [Actinomadura sp. K4S16]|uniref:hypothetical protein n=1 Tax=Actinomadura sp. K4S16 TaxID=1316147 RepID=UPI0011EDDA44|nr:hypothetical protein [Actinomadura sp. K4S16]